MMEIDTDILVKIDPILVMRIEVDRDILIWTETVQEKILLISIIEEILAGTDLERPVDINI
jgi:hypothetical protein